MDAEKYDRAITLLCPTCGCTEFRFEKGVDESIEVAVCASCERAILKDDLIEENLENINEHVSEMGGQILKDVATELRNSLKNAFSGNKNIRFK